MTSDATTKLRDFPWVADVVREELLRTGYIPNSCILAARMTGIVLRQLGVTGVEAMACEVDAFSPAYVRMRMHAFHLGRELTEPETDEYVEQGAWRVQLSFGEPNPGQENRRGRGYNGHVVTLVDRAWMIDPTLTAMNRPEKGLVLTPPFAWAIDYDETRTAGHVIRTDDGAVVTHRLVPGRKDFVKAPDWRLVPRSHGRAFPGTSSEGAWVNEDATITRILDRLQTRDWK